MLQAFYNLIGPVSNTYMNHIYLFGAIMVILFTITSFLQLISSLFKGK